MATLKELSERTGYSPATISRILNGDPSLSVTPDARRKVLEEAGRLNYTATRSRRGRTPKAALRLGIAEMLTPIQQLEDPYYLYLSNFVHQGCLDKKYICITLECKGDLFLSPDKEQLDGIIAIGLFTPNQIESLAAITSNVVFLDSSPFESRFDSVVLGYELGISLALEHFTELNHRKLGFIGPAFKLDDRRQKAPEVRRQLFLRLTEQQNFPAPVLLDCPMDAESAARTMEEFLKQNTTIPSAFLCANEEIAIGALRSLHAANRAVPEQVSVVSFNDTPKSALVEPPLTSVSSHVEEMARTALRMVGERAVLADKPPVRTLPLKIVVPPSLVVRKSTAPAASL